MYTPLYVKTDNSLLSSLIKVDELIEDKSGFVVDKPGNINNISDYVASIYHKNESDPDENGKKHNYNYNCGTMTYGQLEYYLNKNPKYQGFEKKIKNPMYRILELIECIRDLKDEYDFDTSYLNEYRIVFWCE